MKLDPAEFNAFLNGIGQDASWRRAYACPCVNPHSGQAKPACALCAGNGRMWDAAVSARTGIAGRSAQKSWAQFGMWDAGDVLLSIPSDSPLYDIGPFDRVILKNRTEPFSINLVKGLNDRIRFPSVSIARVMWQSPTDESLVIGDSPAVGADGALIWSGTMPPNGVTISLSGRRQAEFFNFYEMPFDRPHHAGAALPRSVVLRRFDLYGQ